MKERISSLANRIKTARTRAGLNQVELANICSVSPALICNLECGKIKSLRDSTLFQMAEALHRSPEWLAFGNGKSKSPIVVPKVELDLLAAFRKLSDSDKKMVVRLVHDLGKKQARTS